MKPELAEQLLYESEATLRLVDSLLDELQSMDDHLPDGLGMRALQLTPEVDSDDDDQAPELLSAAADEARRVLASLARSRTVLDRATQELEARWATAGRVVPAASELRARLESVSALVDRLDESDGKDSLPLQIRAQLLELLEGARVQEITEQRLSYASGILRDTELQLASLVQRLSPRPTCVLPFPGMG